MDASELPTPALVVYLDRVKKNAQDMIKRSKEYGVRLRPHFKTSKVVEVAELQLDGTKRGIVVSTVPEAELLAENGFDDILYAIPLANDPVKIQRLSALNEKLSELHVMVDDLGTVGMVIDLANSSTKRWSVFINVDCRYHREGMPHDSVEVIEAAKRLDEAKQIDFQGLYTHCGQSYYSSTTKDVQSVADMVVSDLLKLVGRLKAIGIECENYGLGSTPTCSQPTEMMRKITEWHPGNYIFYDVEQQMLGGCMEEDIACAVVTRVLGHYGSGGCNHMLVDCGWTALTKQGGGKVPSGGYGAIVNHPELKLESMTQEIGKITTVDGSPVQFENFPVGFMFSILPYHSCATCCMHAIYYVVNGEGKIVDKWHPVRGW